MVEHTGMKTESYQTNVKSQGLSIDPRSSTSSKILISNKTA